MGIIIRRPGFYPDVAGGPKLISAKDRYGKSIRPGAPISLQLREQYKRKGRTAFPMDEEDKYWSVPRFRYSPFDILSTYFGGFGPGNGMGIGRQLGGGFGPGRFFRPLFTSFYSPWQFNFPVWMGFEGRWF